MLLERLARLALRAPRVIVLCALLFTVGAALFALPAATGLPAGGYDRPGSEALRAERILDETFGAGGLPIVFTVTAADGVDSLAARAQGAAIVAALRASPHAGQVISYWTTPPQLAAALAGADRRTGLVAARIAGGDKDAPGRARALAEAIPRTGDGVDVAVGGTAMAYSEVEHRSRWDLVRLEAIAIPVTFVALIWIFGSAVAALLPIVVAVCAIAGTTAVLWLIHSVTDVSMFATNIATAVCLALAVDYTLFMVNRYREELAGGASRDRALVRTMQTAGRTVTYSALTMAATLATMMVFPQYMLRSLGYGGVTAVLLSLAGSLVLAPALIVLLGARIDALDLRALLARRRGAPPRRSMQPEDSPWYRISGFAVRHAGAVLALTLTVLLLLGLPFLGVRLAYPDDRALPDSASSRQAGEILRTEFEQDFTGTVSIVLPDGVKSPAAVTTYALALSQVEGVVRVAGPNGMYEHGRPVSAATFDAGMKGTSAYLSVSTNRDPMSEAGRTQLARLREVPAPAPVLFGGVAQRNLDNIAGVTDRLPLILGLIVVITLVLMFLMTGSVVMPFKILLTNIVSLTAAFGVMVWIFQDGHLGGLGAATTGYTIAIVPPMLACMAYALSMDYAVFVLSRVREEWLRTDRTAAGNARAVALGLARTGRIVTAAAIVMVIVFLGISAGEVSFMRGLGIGLTVSVLVDAFVIRVLLVPALMALLGRANWWAPEPLRRWHARFGLHESPEPSNPAPAPLPELVRD